MHYLYRVEAYRNLAWQDIAGTNSLDTAKAWMDTLNTAGYRCRLITVPQ